uniref:Uncharacterized protein n=1 Tax=Panagrolaimus sp. JU765 TaxID=591449 RepID=A0AC34QG33_9BILA
MASPRLPILLRFPVSRLSFLRFCSGKNVQSASEKQNKVYEKPLYATKYSYEATLKTDRQNREATESTGYQPSAVQKWLLVVTGLYSTRASIPTYVPAQTMQRLHDRNRVLFIFVAVVLFGTFFFIMEHGTSKKIERDRANGKVVTKMA